MNGDVHVRFCEGAGVKFPRATRPADSGPSFSWFSSNLNDRFREKRTLGLALAVKIAEPKALGRKQTFIPRPRVLSIGDSILFAVLCRTQAGASSDQSVESSEGRGDLREFCVFECERAPALAPAAFSSTPTVRNSISASMTRG